MSQFHNATKSAFSKGGKILTAFGVMGVILATTACGSTGTNDASPSSSTSVSASPTSTEVKSNIAGTVVNGIPTKKELAYDGKNYYIQTTIASDDPAMAYDPHKATDIATTLFSTEEIQEGQIFATTYVAEEVLDSILNDNYADKENIDKWLKNNKEKFDSAQFPAFEKSVSSPYTGEGEALLRGGWREGKYELSGGPEQTRILSRTMTPTAIRADTIEGKDYLEYEVKVRVSYKVKINGQDSIETVDAVIQTVIGKDPVTGKWVIAGGNNKFTPTPAV